jgi:hypothetical protein
MDVYIVTFYSVEIHERNMWYIFILKQTKSRRATFILGLRILVDQLFFLMKIIYGRVNNFFFIYICTNYEILWPMALKLILKQSKSTKIHEKV